MICKGGVAGIEFALHPEIASMQQDGLTKLLCYMDVWLAGAGAGSAPMRRGRHLQNTSSRRHLHHGGKNNRTGAKPYLDSMN